MYWSPASTGQLPLKREGKESSHVWINTSTSVTLNDTSEEGKQDAEIDLTGQSHE